MKADLSLVLDLEVSLHHRLIRVTVADHRYREASISIRTTAKTTPIIITRQSRITQAVGITMSITIVVVSTTTVPTVDVERITVNVAVGVIIVELAAGVKDPAISNQGETTSRRTSFQII